MRIHNLILLTTIVGICLAAMPTAAVGRLGGWFPLPDINDPHIQELGGIDKVALVFKRVVSGQYQIVTRIIEASNPNGKYSAF
jgi:hypothetical protein